MKIRYRIWIVLMLIYSFTSLSLYFLFSNNFKLHLQKGYEEISLHQGGKIIEEVRETYPDEPIRSASYIQLANEEFEGRVLILDQQKRVFADGFIKLAKDTQLDLRILNSGIMNEAMFVQTDEYGYVQYTLISFEENGVSGYLLLIEEVNQLRNELKALQNWMLGALVVATIPFFIISYLVSHWISSPIKKIITSLKSITPEKRSFQLKYRKRDEIKQLIDAIHNMVEELNIYDVRQRQFISLSSHELKTPLATMNLILENLPYVREEEAIFQEYVQDLSYEVDKMKSMVEQLMQINRLWDKKLEKEIIHSMEIQDHIQQKFQYMIQDKKMALLFEIEPVSFQVDRTLLLQGIDNLVSNGIRYSNQEGSITVDIRKSPAINQIEICVMDEGIGISELDISHIFEPFYRSNDSTAWNSEGSGLGLFIVKKMVEMHKGTVSVTSKLNKGTKVQISLPM